MSTRTVLLIVSAIGLFAAVRPLHRGVKATPPILGAALAENLLAFAAVEQGTIPKGLRTFETKAGILALEHLLNGELHFAVVDQTALLASGANDLVVLASLGRYYDFGILVRKDRGLRSFADLEAVSVGVVGDYASLSRLAQFETFCGFPLDPTIIEEDRAEDLFRNGRIAALLVTGERRRQLLAEGDPDTLELVTPPELAGHQLLVTTSSVLASWPDVAREILEGLLAAESSLTDVRLRKLARTTGQPPELVVADRSRLALSLSDPRTLDQDLAHDRRWLVDHGVKLATLTIDPLPYCFAVEAPR